MIKESRCKIAVANVVVIIEKNVCIHLACTDFMFEILGFFLIKNNCS